MVGVLFCDTMIARHERTLSRHLMFGSLLRLHFHKSHTDITSEQFFYTSPALYGVLLMLSIDPPRIAVPKILFGPLKS